MITILFRRSRSAFNRDTYSSRLLISSQMALESWQAKNWDPAVGSNEFDEFCSRINHPFSSLEEAVEATGVDVDDVIALASTPGFDTVLLNYATYVRTVSRFKAWLFSCSPPTENPSYVPNG